MIRKHKAFGWLSNIAWISGTVLAAYVLIKAYFFSSGLPAGSCPLILSRPWITISIVLLALSFIFSLFEPERKKKSNNLEVEHAENEIV